MDKIVNTKNIKCVPKILTFVIKMAKQHKILVNCQMIFSCRSYNRRLFGDKLMRSFIRRIIEKYFLY